MIFRSKDIIINQPNNKDKLFLEAKLLANKERINQTNITERRTIRNKEVKKCDKNYSLISIDDI